MEWQQLLGFWQTAKLGSFTKAAVATFRTQSALTQQIKALEEELQCQLFERLGRHIRLTQAGEKLLKFAEETFARYERLKEDLRALQGRHQGRLKMAAPFTTLYHLVPSTIQEYIKRFPYVELTILDRPQRQVVALVQDGDVDLGLVLETVAPKNLTRTRWCPVRTALMVPEGHPLIGAGKVTPGAIARYPLILPPKSLEHLGRERLEEIFRREGLEFRVIMESANVELTALYVEMGLGVGVATLSPDFLPMRHNLVFLPLDHLFRPNHLVVIAKPRQFRNPHQKAFLEMLRQRPGPFQKE